MEGKTPRECTDSNGIHPMLEEQRRLQGILAGASPLDSIAQSRHLNHSSEDEGKREKRFTKLEQTCKEQAERIKELEKAERISANKTKDMERQIQTLSAKVDMLSQMPRSIVTINSNQTEVRPGFSGMDSLQYQRDRGSITSSPDDEINQIDSGLSSGIAATDDGNRYSDRGDLTTHPQEED